MIDNLLFALTFVSALGCGLMAGVFFAFSAFVMHALARLPPAQGIAAMQSIGGGISEAGGTISTIVLLCLTPSGSADFWLTLVALLGLIGMQAVYWLFTHPVNKFWLEGENLDRFSSVFFSFGAHRSRLENETRPPDWTQLRDRWEYLHVGRAGLALLSLIVLVIAISCRKF